MFDNENKEFSEHLVTINRVAKVVKGGRRFGFAAIMIVGDNKGRVGYGTGKAKEVPEAVRKASENAKSKIPQVGNLTKNFWKECIPGREIQQRGGISQPFYWVK